MVGEEARCHFLFVCLLRRCIPKAVRMCQGGNDHLFASSTSSADNEAPYVDLPVEPNRVI